MATSETLPRAAHAPLSLSRCALARGIDLIGDRWSLLILREAFYGVSRFEAIREDLDIPRAALSGRLKRLIKEGLLKKTPYKEPGRRQRHEYRLTEKGRGLMSVLLAIMDWAIKNEPEGLDWIEFTHRASGERAKLKFVSAGGAVVEDPSELRLHVRTGREGAG